MSRASLATRWRVNACLLLALGCNHASAQPSPQTVVRRALIQRLVAGGADSALREDSIPPAEVRTIVKENLDSTLAASLRTAAGTDFRFHESQRQTDAQVSVLVLTYENRATAERMNRALAKRQGYFTGSKVLTRFSSVPVRNQLVIAFTENAGNDAVVGFVNGVPRLFD